MTPNLFDLDTIAQTKWKTFIDAESNTSVAEAMQNYIENMQDKNAIPIFKKVFLRAYINCFRECMTKVSNLPLQEISEFEILSKIYSDNKAQFHELYSRIIRDANKYIGGTRVKKLARLINACFNFDENYKYELFDLWKKPLELNNSNVGYTDDEEEDIAYLKEELGSSFYEKQIDQFTTNILLMEAETIKTIQIEATHKFNDFLNVTTMSVAKSIHQYLVSVEEQYSKSPNIVIACVETLFTLYMSKVNTLVYTINDILELIDVLIKYKPEVSKDIYIKNKNSFDQCIETIEDFANLLDLYAPYPDCQEELYQRYRDKLTSFEFCNDLKDLKRLTKLLPRHKKEIIDLRKKKLTSSRNKSFNTETFFSENYAYKKYEEKTIKKAMDQFKAFLTAKKEKEIEIEKKKEKSEKTNSLTDKMEEYIHYFKNTCNSNTVNAFKEALYDEYASDFHSYTSKDTREIITLNRIFDNKEELIFDQIKEIGFAVYIQGEIQKLLDLLYAFSKTEYREELYNFWRESMNTEINDTIRKEIDDEKIKELACYVPNHKEEISQLTGINLSTLFNWDL